MPVLAEYGAPQRPYRPEHKPDPEQQDPSQLTALTPQPQPERPLLRGNQELRRVNPTLPTGRRQHRHHQWFTPDPGYIKLNQHLAAVTALMRAAPNWTAFQRGLQRAFPKLNENIPLALDS